MKLVAPEGLPDLLEPSGRRPWLALLAGVLAVGGLTALRIWLSGVLGVGLPFLLYVFAVISAAWLGGWMAGLVTTMLAAFAGVSLFLGSGSTFFALNTTDRVSTLIFLGVGALVSGVCEALHRSRERVEIRTRDLELEIRERHLVDRHLRELSHRKDEFLAILAHELRNPLTPIVNAAALLHGQQGDDPIITRAAQLIDRHANHMVHLIDDLLDVARIERGTFELRLTTTDVREVIETAIEYCRGALTDQEHHLELRFPEGHVTVHADHLRLVQVVANLLHNAVTYTPSGGCISLHVSVEEGDLVVRVRDNGSGVEPQRMERIFEMFERGARQAPSTGGLGIGLALVRQITSMHGGTVRGESAGPGKGREFTVRIPGATFTPTSAPSTVATLADTNGISGHNMRVLVVDDNPDLLESLSLVLKLLGHEVDVATNGQDALTRMAAGDPQVVLMDVGMPGMSGYEAAERARREPWGAKPTMVAMTGWGRDEDRARALEAGFDRHVVKPLDLEALKSLFASIDAGSR